MTPRLTALAAAASVAACATSGPSVESRTILARPQATKRAEVTHILLGYSWLASKYRQMGMSLDPRAEKRNETATEQLAQQLLSRIERGELIEPLMKEFSEDPGSAANGQSYTVDPGSQMVEEFKDLALRLSPGEAGIVKSAFGYHVMKRIQ